MEKINLMGSFFEMGLEYGKKRKIQIKNLAEKKEIEFPNHIFRKWKEFLPNNIKELIHGVSKGSNIDYDSILKYHFYYETKSYHCTLISVTDIKNPWALRILDQDLLVNKLNETFKLEIINFNNKVTQLGFSGVLFCFTGLNSSHLFVGGLTWYKINKFRVMDNCTSVLFRLTDALFKATDIDQYTEILKSNEIIYDGSILVHQDNNSVMLKFNPSKLTIENCKSFIECSDYTPILNHQLEFETFKEQVFPKIPTKDRIYSVFIDNSKIHIYLRENFKEAWEIIYLEDLFPKPKDYIFKLDNLTLSNILEQKQIKPEKNRKNPLIGFRKFFTNVKNKFKNNNT